MSIKSLHKIWLTLLLSLVPVLGTVEAARSQKASGTRPRPIAEEALAADSIPALVKLFNHSDFYTRTSAVFLLGRRGEAAQVAIPNLISLLKDESEHMRLYAAQALGDIGRPAIPSAAVLK